MHFAQITTIVAAVLMAPLAVAAVGPSMGSGEFVSAARCVAYASLPQVEGASASLRVAQFRLDAEATRQPAEVAATARTEVREIYAQAAAVDAAELRQAHAQACGQARALLANRVLAPGAV